MDENFFRKITTIVILAVLVVLSFSLLKPILMSIIWGIILAFIFSPIYNFINRKTKLKTLPALFICILLLSLIVLPLWFFTPILIDQSIKIYTASQQLDLVTPLKKIFPSIFASDEFAQEVGSVLYSFITKTTNSLMNYFSQLLIQFPTLLLQILVIFFTFFYMLKDKDILIKYIKSLLPFSKDVEKKLFDSTKDITFSVLYGQVIIGLIQGVVLGIGLFLFGVPNAIIWTMLAVVAGILPIIGPSLVGVPAAIYFIIGGNYFSAIGILAFTLLSSLSDHIFRPLLVSKRTKLHTGVVLIGMIGGFFLFGVLGFILGPLILAYLIIVVEVYKDKQTPSVLIQDTAK